VRADGLLRQMQALGRTTEAGGIRDCEERSQMPEINRARTVHMSGTIATTHNGAL
jgi:hypothetical protein